LEIIEFKMEKTKTMTKCKKCEELLSILKEVKQMMDSESYSYDFDGIYDKIAFAVAKG